MEGIEDSGYRLGAYQALEWTWRLLRRYQDSQRGLEKARQDVLRELSKMGRGEQVSLTDEDEAWSTANQEKTQ